MVYYTAQYDSPLGTIGLVCSDKALVSLWLPGHTPFGKEAQPLPCPDAHPILDQAARWLDRYFAGERLDAAELPLAPEGSPFRQTVWKLLLEIPWGQTATYGQLAAKAATVLCKKRMSAQAVGQAVGENPIAIIIPCHRCLGANRQLTGYAGGLHLKRAMLDMEEITYNDRRSSR